MSFLCDYDVVLVCLLCNIHNVTLFAVFVVAG